MSEAKTASGSYSQVPQKNQDVEMTNKKDGDESGPSSSAGAVAAAPGDDVICLKPKMTLLNGITVIVGSIIGSGIFVSPKGVLENTGSVGLSLSVWIISGIFSTIGAYCYAELGCMITKTGADYAYIMESFGPFVAFLRLWIECMIVRPCSQAIVALTFSFYVLRPIFPDCDPPADAVRYLACICIVRNDIASNTIVRMGKKPKSNDVAASNANGDAICLKPKMTLINGINVIVGCMIGSGIFISPKGVIQGTGSVGLSLVVWMLSGIFSLIGSYCYAELGTTIPKSGADYAYIMECFGPFLAFLRLWIECMIVRPCNTAIIALAFSFYTLRPFYPDCDPPNEAIRLLAIVCICLLTFVNCWDVKWSTRVQDFFTYGKLLALATIIITGIYQLALGNTGHFTFDQDPMIEKVDITTIALSFYSGLFAYNGWNYLNFVIEELKDPHKNLPIAIFTSCILVTVVYTMTIIAFHSTLSVSEVLSAEAVAVTFAERLYGWMAWIVPVFVALSTFGGVNGILFTSSRLFYAGAEQKQMPEILAMIQVDHLTPTPAVIFMCILSLVYLASKDIYALINYVGFATWLAIGLGVACLPYLRWKRPDLARPIKVNLIWPTIYIAASIFITIVPMLADPKGTGMGVLIILTGVPVYFIFIGWKNKPKFLQNMIDGLTLLLQKIMVVVPSEKSEKL
ncbi:hypothetical protein RDWZM_001072 [Blomia tropicalis]|uniref:Y+L amino acid transporter 2 n=1 Tax=Blomia tropicalis TaxID=40697 RepID=A0A9Q0MDZ1_BLOTA|nr:hypothetical protein RDWZM_001072 [Blomia tropicalis]